MKIIGVIPARFNSSRFPGKPLADILGKPMVWWVYSQAKKVSLIDEIYVATDNEKIVKVCNELGMNVMLTKESHVNGTERVAEVAANIEADIYITLQGDEPLFEPYNIDILIQSIINDESILCSTLKTVFINPIDVVNSTTPTVVSDNDDNIILISRSAIPYPKESLDYHYYKPTGQYAFRPEILKKYLELKMGKIEKIEGIELLRLIENGFKIKITEVKSDTISVDTPKDLYRLIKFLEERDNNV